MRNKKQYFSSLLQDLINDEDIEDNEMRYLIGCLIRGGAVTKAKN